ncbi:hypothetical protein NLJ89_g11499 [Agrocybe chaxingu]|uniref:Uncharacterized protein n=1 Tax=Agrocybe chaxingu TaxID=84603 RepID=A0A9W8MRK5_9AGAR|nr:hypothetical protein NLJ89_g11499 [Agrocybe chaxingu]
MAQYPYRHSTYFTGRDPTYTSELPPMNSTEDILQEIFMRDRNTVYIASPRYRRFKKLFSVIKNWRRKTVDSSFLNMPRSPRVHRYFF